MLCSSLFPFVCIESSCFIYVICIYNGDKHHFDITSCSYRLTVIQRILLLVSTENLWDPVAFKFLNVLVLNIDEKLLAGR